MKSTRLMHTKCNCGCVRGTIDFMQLEVVAIQWHYRLNCAIKTN
jgi:hypothetical protein